MFITFTWIAGKAFSSELKCDLSLKNDQVRQPTAEKATCKVRLRYGENCKKLVHFKEKKKIYFVFLKHYNLARFLS
jgi:hypothetical protein